jgi:hypothetical protein
MDRDHHIQSVEDELAALTRGFKGNGAAKIERTPHANQIVEACKKAAEMVRDVHRTYEAEAETLARHIEGIGANIKQMFDELAKTIREAHVMPREMAAKTAEELLDIGSKEAERHDRVSHGLLGARNAVLEINGSTPNQLDRHERVQRALATAPSNDEGTNF